MVTRTGTQFSNADLLKKADGRLQNASLRDFENGFNLATEGGDIGPYLMAKLRGGVIPKTHTIESTANLSALTFTVGTILAPSKYAAAFAGPNNGTVIARTPLVLPRAETADAPEDIYLFPSAAMPGAGILRTTLTVSKR